MTPHDLLLDEPFEGLAPLIVRDLGWRTSPPRAATIVVEQNIAAALSFANRVYGLNNGHVVELHTRQALQQQPDILHRHLGVYSRTPAAFPPHSYGEVSASYADGGVMSTSRVAHDPSVADYRATSP